MKKIVLTLSVLMCLSILGISQCTYPVLPEPSHVRIQSDQSVDASGIIYWVCEGVTVTVTSSEGAAFYLEENAAIIFENTIGDFVVATEGTSITNNTTSAISVAANSSTITTQNNSSGSILVTIECAEVVIDGTFSGATSCDASVGISELENTNVEIYPNPLLVGQDLKINLTNVQVEIYNNLGQLVRTEWVVNGIIKTHDFEAGPYIVFIHTSDGTVRKNLVLK